MTAPIFLTKYLLPVFNKKDNEFCKIVNIISTYGIVPPNQSIYNELSIKTGVNILKPIGYPVTKAGLSMVTKYLSTYLGREGFNVNGLAPGGIENGQDKVFIEAYSKQVPMGRMGKVEEILPMIDFLCSRNAGMMSSCLVPIDGAEGKSYNLI